MEIVFIIVGLIFAGIGFYFIFDTKNFREIAEQTQGKVVGYESHESRSSKGGTTTMYNAVVEFNHRGDTYRFKGSIGSSNMPYEVGEMVPVLFMADDPHNARIRTNLRYVLGGIFAGLGTIATVVGLFTFQTDKFSLIIAAVIIGVFLIKALRFKKKMAEKGITSLKDVKNLSKVINASSKTQATHQDVTADSLLDNLGDNSVEKKNYQPSENLIRSEEDAKRTSGRAQAPAWLGYIFMLVGIGLLVGAGFMTKNTMEFMDVALSTEGTIVSSRSSYSDGSTTYAPVIEYVLPESGHKITFKHSVSSSHPGWSIGDRVKVLYHPNDPQDAMMDDGWFNWFGSIILGGIGSVFTFVGFFVSRATRKNKNPRRARSRRV